MKKTLLAAIVLLFFVFFETSAQCTITRSISGNLEVCPGSTGNVYTTQAGMSDYTWYTTGVVTAGGTSTDNTITITAPDTPGGILQVFVNYTDTDGCNDFLDTILDVSLIASPPASISGNKTVCKNSTHTYTTEAGKSNYQWVVPAGGTVISGGTPSDNAVTVSWTQSVTNMRVSYINANGCKSVSPVPAGSIQVNAPAPIHGNDVVCQGAVNSYYILGQSNYAWSVAGGVIVSGGTASDNFVDVKWTSAGTYSVSASYAAPAGGCTPSSPVVKNVTVNATPTITPINGSPTVCQGIATTYTTESGKINYSWTVPGGQIVSGSNNSVSVKWDTPGAKTISVNYFSNGCPAPTPAVLNVLVNETPVPSIFGNATVCQGVGDVYTTDPGKSNYVWQVNTSPIAMGTIISGGTSTDHTATIAWNTPGTKIFRVTYTSASGCVGISQKEVTVSTSADRPISGQFSACVGSNQIYTTTSGKENYSWSVTGGTIVSGGNSNEVTVNWSQSGNQTISVFYSDGSCVPSAPTSKPVSVKPVPAIPSILGNSNACLNAAGTTYITDSGKGNYTWNVTGGTFGQNDTNSISVFWNSSGPQTVSVNYTENGCYASVPAIKAVNVSWPASLSGNTIVCQNSSHTYTTEAGMSNYFWSVPTGGIITAGGDDASNYVTVKWYSAGARTVSVRYTDGNGCNTSSPIKNVTVNTLPSPSFNGNASVCQQAPGNVYITDTGKSNYVWYVSSGGTVTAGGTSNDNTITVTWAVPAGPDQYNQFVSVNYTDVNGCTAANAARTGVAVYDPISPYVAINNGSSNSEACVETGVNYYTQSGQNNYTWSFSPGGTIVAGGGPTSNTATVVWHQPGDQIVNVDFTSPINCKIPGAGSKTISVKPRPVPSINGNAVVALNSTGNVYTTTPPPGSHNYLWSVSSGGTITAGGTPSDRSVTVTWHTLGSQTVSLNYESSYDCAAPEPSVKNISVNAPTYVTIPDANFRAFLKTKYPGCFNTSDEMNIYCTAVIGETSLIVNNKSIANLSGAEYFINLTELDCASNLLTSLPSLPGNLVTLSCYNNQLTQLPALPASLVTLECTNNALTSLPSLHASLVTLLCANNQLASLPSLPGTLIVLDCANNQLTALPALPATLAKLTASNNALSSLPVLPVSLNDLNVRSNNLSTIPTLPVNLTSLDCSVNQVPSLPSLPATITTLKCSSNLLTSLPTLPPALTTLDCGNNDLTSLPPLPGTLQTLVCNDNELITLPSLPTWMDLLNCSGNHLTSLPPVAVTTYADISRNELDFADLQPFHALLYFSASPQSYTITPSTRTIVLGQPFGITVGGTANNYQWYKDNVAIAGATNATLYPQTTGIYKCLITSNVADMQGITIVSSQVSITVLLPQTVTINAFPGKSYGAPPFNLSATGGPSGNPIVFTCSDPSIATISGNTVTIVGVGSAIITASQAGNAQYAPASTTRALHVSREFQEIVFNSLTPKNLGDVFTVSATASSNLPVSFASSNTSVATISGNVVTVVGVGTSTITASQAGDANYIPAAPVSQLLTVNKVNQTITFYALQLARTVGDAFTISPSATSGLPVTLSSSNSSVATITGNLVNVVGPGTVKITASQPGNTTYNPAPAVWHEFVVSEFLISGRTPYCQGGSTILTSNANSYNQDLSFLWSNGQTSASIVVSTPGTYWLTMTNSLTGNSVISNSFAVDETPNLNGAYITSSTNECHISIPGYTETVVLTANPAGTGYTWYKGATPLNLHAQSISVSSPGNYNVVITSPNGVVRKGCYDLIPCNYHLKAAPGDIVQDVKSDDISAFPNPADLEVIIQLPETANLRTPLHVFDQLGHLIELTYFEKGEFEKIVDTSRFKAGMYLIEIASPKGMIRKKVIILHKN